MHKLNLSGILFLLLTFGSSACQPMRVSAAGFADHTNGVPLTQEEQNFLGLINNLRSQNGLNPLSVDARLQASAQQHSDFMNNLGLLTHMEPLPNYSSGDRIVNAGADFADTGENIACGNEDAQATFTQWYNSPEHLENMLDSDYEYIGIARAGDDADADSAGCPFYWTTDFGGGTPLDSSQN